MTGKFKNVKINFKLLIVNHILIYLIFGFIPQNLLMVTEAYAQGDLSSYQKVIFFEKNKEEYARPIWRYRVEQVNNYVNSHQNANFEMRSLVELKGLEQRFNKHSLDLKFSGAEKNLNGWGGAGGTFRWNKQEVGATSSLAIPLGGVNKTPLNNFDSIIVDYGSSGVTPKCTLDFKLSGEKKNLKTGLSQSWTASTEPKGAEDSSGVIKINGDNWAEKKLISLQNQLPNTWTYAKKESGLVLEMMLAIDLNSPKALQVYVPKNLNVESINLKLSTQKSTRILNLPVEISLQAEKKEVLKDENKYTFNFPSGVNKLLKPISNVDEPALILQNITINLAGEESQILSMLNAKPAIEVLVADEPKFLAMSDWSFNERNKRIGIDILGLYKDRNKKIEDVNLSHIEMILGPRQGSDSCAITLNSIKLAGGVIGRVPILFSPIRDWNFHLGGPIHLPDDLQIGSIELPKIKAYTSFSSGLGIPADNIWTGSYKPTRISKYTTGWVPRDAEGYKDFLEGSNSRSITQAKVNEEMNSLIDSQGNLIKGEKARPDRVVRLTSGVVLNYGSDSIKASWPLNILLGRNTFFYYGTSDPGEVKSAYLSLSRVGLPDQIIQVAPNKAVQLTAGDKNAITKATLKIFPKTRAYKLQLQDAAFFQPEVISYQEALDIKLPLLISQMLIAAPEKGMVHKRDTETASIAGIVEQGQFAKFTTPLEIPLQNISGIGVDYKFDNTKDYAVNRCVINLDLVFENGRIRKKLCSHDLSNKIYFDSSQILKGLDGGVKDYGELRSIDWWINNPDEAPIGAQSQFEIRATVIGWADIRPVDAINFVPLFESNKNHFFIKNNDFKMGLMNGSKVPHLQFRLNNDSITKLANSSGDIYAVSNEYFDLTRVDVAPIRPIEFVEWELMTSPPAVGMTPTKMGFAILLMAGLLSLIIYGCMRFNYQDNNVKKITNFLVGHKECIVKTISRIIAEDLNKWLMLWALAFNWLILICAILLSLYLFIASINKPAFISFAISYLILVWMYSVNLRVNFIQNRFKRIFCALNIGVKCAGPLMIYLCLKVNIGELGQVCLILFVALYGYSCYQEYTGSKSEARSNIFVGLLLMLSMIFFVGYAYFISSENPKGLLFSVADLLAVFALYCIVLEIGKATRLAERFTPLAFLSDFSGVLISIAILMLTTALLISSFGITVLGEELIVTKHATNIFYLSMCIMVIAKLLSFVRKK